jgi:uncharacterized protein YyaL (SSP411 family)
MAEEPFPADEGVAGLLRRGYVPVRVDGDERPDVADLVRLTVSIVSETVAPADAALWAVFTPSLHPVAAGTLSEAPAASLGQGLAAIADAYDTGRADIEARAGIAAARVASAQTPEPAQGPLTRAAVDRALKNASQPGEGRPANGSLRLLRAEVLVTGSPAARAALAEALDRLAVSPEPPTLGAQALRLRALAEGTSILGLPSLSAATEKAAASLLAHTRRGGAFVAGPEDDRAFAYANGLAVGALAASSTVSGSTEQRNAAAEAATAALALLGPWPSLVRCASPERRCGAAYLEDYAFLAEGLLDLHDATADPRWRTEARAAVDAAIARFLDSSAGGFFDTDSAHEPLPARLKDAYDGSRPSANGVMAQVLLRLARETGEKRYADLARRTVDAFRGDLQAAPRGLETLAAVADVMVSPQADTPTIKQRSSRETRGPVTVEASLTPDHVGAGGSLEAHVRLTVAAPWKVNGHRPSAGDLVPLTVSVPGDAFVVGAVRYPAEAASTGPVDVAVPLRAARAVAVPGSVRLAVRFQACDGPRCAAPESLILEAPLTVEAAAR